MKPQIPWLRVFVEGVVIVGSILLAFGIDAWWEGAQERERRVALLRGLESDLAFAGEDLGRVILRHERALDSSERLLSFTNAGVAAQSLQATVDSLLTDLLFVATFDPPMGTLEALVGSGDLEVLSSIELARELTRWPALVEDMREDEAMVLNHTASTLNPYLRERVRVSDLVWSEAMEEWKLPWEHGYTESYQMLSDLGFENVIYDLWNSYKTIVEEAHPLVHESLMRLQAMISAELDH